MEAMHIRGHTGRVNAVRFTPDGRYVVSAGDDHSICIHALRDGHLFRRLIGHSKAVYDVAVTPNGRYIVSGSADGTVRVWHAATGREVTHTDLYAGSAHWTYFRRVAGCRQERRYACGQPGRPSGRRLV